ncbi:3-oxoacyl-[acyl-carrier protein] reductase (EC [Kosakonia radicincitans]|uniref:SDR family NAD(P)-dependent oxidoreductase n=1 Tax=Kosakonia radicincitans TaxID=283686 RepID=UPI001182B888|nr:SDR family NAD(P)-dependent oxidoreductase [Kosakonia radicincitans]VVT48906.1 3-oxoacyl-[acyl-carrier protein] reductase (EC [Kosakonia radicincitans]
MYKYSDLKNKTVLVSGANGDIGRAICQQYLEQHAVVYALHESCADQLHELKTEHPEGQNLHIVHCNLADPEAVAALGSRLTSETGKVDVLVNNADVVNDNLFASMRFDDFSSVIDGNMLNTFRLTKEILRLLRSAENASVINVASIAAIVPAIGQSNYSASNGALLAFTRTLAAELAPQGIRVNAVAPGMIESTNTKEISGALVREMADAIPLQRIGRSSEVANTIVYLSSSAASYIVGQSIIIDGGMVMR